MSSIYGDSIFESNNMIIDRLFESINNYMLMFKDFNIIKEDNNDTFWADFKKVIATIIAKIKQLIAKIVQKVKDIKNKVKADIIIKDIEKTIKNNEYTKILILDPEKFNKLTREIMTIYRGIESTNLDEVIANEDRSYIDGVKERTKQLTDFF